MIRCIGDSTSTAALILLTALDVILGRKLKFFSKSHTYKYEHEDSDIMRMFPKEEDWLSMITYVRLVNEQVETKT